MYLVKVPLTVQFTKCMRDSEMMTTFLRRLDINVIQNLSWETSTSVLHASKQTKKKGLRTTENSVENASYLQVLQSPQNA